MAMEIITSAISIWGAAQGLYKWATGTTVSDRLDGMMKSLTRLEDRIFLMEKNELDYVKRIKQKSSCDYQDIFSQLRRLQQISDSNLVISRAISIPNNLVEVMSSAPEEFLYDIKPIKTKEDFLIPSKDDLTIVPVTFSRWGQEFVGHTKRGYLAENFNLSYSPYFLSSSINGSTAHQTHKTVIRNDLDTRYACLVCSKPADAVNGSMCKRCNAFIHKNCQKCVKTRKSVDWMVLAAGFCTRVYVYACPICGSVIRKEKVG